eukprot:GILI01025739.1.p1 GENE.GILI01025739.1~~GILI01025739.1.p1  ORF type:complete len:641 (+),score=61.60 GILI01025739.1:105-1925(+)
MEQLIQDITYGNYTEVRRKLNHGADINFISKHGATLMHAALACTEGTSSFIIALLFDVGFGDYGIMDINGHTPLHLAVQRDLKRTAMELISVGAPVSQPDGKGNTSLHAASEHFFHADFVAPLIKAGADVHAINKKGQTPLHLSTRQKGTLLLISAGADVSAQDNNGDTPLHLSIARGDADSVDALLQAKADATVANNKGQTPLHRAMSKDHPSMSILQYLRAASPDVSAVDENGNTAFNILLKQPCTNLRDGLAQYLLRCSSEDSLKVSNNVGVSPLHLAAANGYPVIVKALVDAGVPTHLVDNEGNTALHRALMRTENAPAVGYLLNDPHRRPGLIANKQGSTQLHLAINNRLPEYASRLIFESSGVDSSVADSNGNTPLHLALHKRLSRTAIELIGIGVNLSSPNKSGRTPLQIASIEGFTDIVSSLISSDPNLSSSLVAVDSDGNTPLHLSLMYRHNDISEMLLRLHEKNTLSIRNKLGRSYLCLASAAGLVGIVKALLGAGVTGTTPDEFGNTALHLAILRRDLPTVTVLAEGGGQVLLGTPNNNGSTPLHTAVSAGSGEAVAVLVRLGASLAAKDNNGHTPPQLAETKGLVFMAPIFNVT